MNYLQNVVEVYEVEDIDRLNELLNNNGIIIDTCVKRCADDVVYEHICYSVGIVDLNRKFK